ncbi:glycosyltransferase family 1 protein [Asaia sp. BMEF1]|uniref:glycosyltransferase family 4 protein n=1 Tax=Asaia sp. BMEF1 TaxID=3155932 RepID=UPI003F661506
MHDLIPMLQPDLCGSGTSRTHRRLKQCGDAAVAIVTVSDAVRDDIIEHLAYPADKVVNLSQPVSFSPSLIAEARREAVICPPGSFLYFGLLERRKNIGRMIRAHGLSGSHRSLVLIGKQGFGAEEELAALAEHPAPQRVQILPWCSRASLVRAILEARCVFFPSLAEGFGLPIAEAMTLGTPVITSQGHATEEIAGGAAYLVDPCDIEALTVALSRVGSDDVLASRLVEAGYARSQAFTLRAYAERLGVFYGNIVNY